MNDLNDNMILITIVSKVDITLPPLGYKNSSHVKKGVLSSYGDAKFEF